MNVVAVSNDLKETELAELVRAGDAAFERALKALAEEILSLHDVRLLGLTGPTCSGKTTAAAMLTKELEAQGRAVHIISVDDFYYSKEALQRASREKRETGAGLRLPRHHRPRFHARLHALPALGARDENAALQFPHGTAGKRRDSAPDGRGRVPL